MAASYIDFAALKEAHSIESIAGMLGLDVKRNARQLRGPCPACKAGGPRALAINLDRSVYYCFADGKGGDSIALAAHVRGIGPRQAAELIADTLGNPSRSKAPTPSSTAPSPGDRENAAGAVREGGDAFAPLAYLDPAHEAVEMLGLDAQTASALGIGYAPKGILRGTIAVPVRLPDGTLAGYIGITEARLPNHWHGITPDNVVELKRKA
jgi:DNA primase